MTLTLARANRRRARRAYRLACTAHRNRHAAWIRYRDSTTALLVAEMQAGELPLFLRARLSDRSAFHRRCRDHRTGFRPKRALLALV
jgi:hypothetical protein